MSRSRPSGAERLPITSAGVIEHLLRHRPERLESLAFSQASGKQGARLQRLKDLAASKGVRLSQGGDPREPVTGYVKPFEYASLEDLLQVRARKAMPVVVLALDHVQDPQNLGALCRSAEALGVAGVLLPKDRSAAVTEGAYHASVGAVESIPIARVSNLGDGLRKLKDAGFWIVGAALGQDAKPPTEMPSFEKIALLLGAEYEGISPTLEEVCDWKTRIPLVGSVESLNVSVAGALLMYEMLRARAKP